MSVCAYSEILLTPDNAVTIRGEINEETIGKVQTKLAELNSLRGLRVYPIYLVLDSPGGDINVGLSFIEYAKTIPNLHTINLFAASMASAIQQALPGKRIGYPYAISMFHRAAGGFQGHFAEGEVESRLDLAKQMVAILENQNAYRLKMSLPDYKKKIMSEYWLVGRANITGNAIDEIHTVKCSDSLIEKKETMAFRVFIFSIDVTFSQCPMFRYGSVVKNLKDYLEHKKEFNKKLTGAYYESSN
jgi:ATP-dependent protease ClpP protease subunit